MRPLECPSGWSRTWEVRLFFGELYLPFKGKGLNRNEAKAAKGALLSGVAPELMGRGTEVLPCPKNPVHSTLIISPPELLAALFAMEMKERTSSWLACTSGLQRASRPRICKRLKDCSKS